MHPNFVEGKSSLAEADPVVHQLIEDEKARQCTGIELIASENFTSRPVIEALGSPLTNKYSEGYAGQRYYGGNETIDKIESLCQERALKAFSLDPAKWAVNVQPYSGSPANFEVYTGLLNPHDRIMGLDLPSGGHLTHGYYTAKGTKISATSVYFESLPYKVDMTTGLIDYDALERDALNFRPKMIIGGGSAYARDFDHKRFREIADKVGALYMCDMAHISGLVATGEQSSPFEYADVVTTTTHKTLRGPRAGMIFCRVGAKSEGLGGEGDYDYKQRIWSAVFPGLQGGPHNHQIAALAVALKHVDTAEFKHYSRQVCANAVTLCDALKKFDYKFVTDGTTNHIVLWDLRPEEVSGAKMQLVCDAAKITLNKNTVAGDGNALNPGGVRLGSSAMTSRGLDAADFEQVAAFLHEAVGICKDIQSETGKKIKDFQPAVGKSEKVADLRARVEEFSKTFPMPGWV